MPTFSSLAVALLFISPLVAQPVPVPIDPDTGYRRMPWHLADTWTRLGKTENFQSLEVEIDIPQALPENVRVYIAPLGIAYLNDVPFYGGLQTQSDGYSRSNPRLRGIGRGLLMSRWKERDLDWIRPSEGGLFQSSGHEGDFISVRKPFAWTTGRYTYRVCRMETEPENNRTWVGAFLRVHKTGENIFIGSLAFPGTDLTLSADVAQFFEIYGAAIPVETIPKATVRFGPFRINSKPVVPSRILAIYPDNVPDVLRVRVDDENRVVYEVGEEIENRTERRVVVFRDGKPVGDGSTTDAGSDE